MRELAAALLAPVLALACLVVMLPVPQTHDEPSRATGPAPSRRVAVGQGTLSVLVLPGPTLWFVPIIATAEFIHDASSDADAPRPVHARATQ